MMARMGSAARAPVSPRPKDSLVSNPTHMPKARKPTEAKASTDCAVAADEAGAIEAQPDRQPLQRNLLEGLVEGPLHEGRVHREERL